VMVLPAELKREKKRKVTFQIQIKLLL
jgi:hypothetical protein